MADFARTDVPLEALPMDGRRVDDSALSIAGRITGVEPGGREEALLDLPPGRYVWFAHALGFESVALRGELTVQTAEPYTEGQQRLAG